jgi:RimJ/RimL family protein N-acetyltransferase
VNADIDVEGLAAPALAVPRIETPRLVLRAHRLSDLDAYGAMWSDPDVLRHIGGVPLTRDAIWARFLRNRGHWITLNFGYWIMEDRASGRLAGEVGYADFRRDWPLGLTERLRDVPESGWVLPTWAHGRGLASEAARAVLDWGEAERGWRRTFCTINESNLASVRVAEKVGYGEIARAPVKDVMTIFLERPVSWAV